MRKIIMTAILIAAGTAGCRPAREQTAGKATVADDATTGVVKGYPLKGEIIRVNKEDKTATVKHQKIEGFMEAMTMSYRIPEAADLDKIQPGDHITATVYHRESDQRFWLGKIEVVR